MTVIGFPSPLNTCLDDDIKTMQSSSGTCGASDSGNNTICRGHSGYIWGCASIVGDDLINHGIANKAVGFDIMLQDCFRSVRPASTFHKPSLHSRGLRHETLSGTYSGLSFQACPPCGRELRVRRIDCKPYEIFGSAE